MKWNKILILGASLLLLTVIVITYKEQILLAIGDHLIIQDELQPADVIHVIAGDDYRTNYAIQLYQQGYAKVLFFTGGWCEIYGYYHAAHAQELALSSGIPIDAIAYDDTSVTSTYSEAILLKAWIDQSPVPIHSVIVVSDPFHMRRVRWTYKQVFGDQVDLLMAPVAFEVTPFEREWWKNEWARDYVKDEYVKQIYYIARYQLSWGVLKDWLVALDTE